ncbi:MAG: ABC transporter permease, partial [Bacteroidales bacterium]|nr:ABC transporter permease [Bacteroidales bacterium]
MIGNYIELALRQMIRQRAYVFINVTGLAVGLACSILIALFVISELSYDDFHEKKDRIWRLYLDGKLGETELKGAWTCSPAAPAFKQDFPEVVDAVRINTWGETVIKYKDRSFIEDGFMEADSTFFNIFSIPIIQGDPQTALAAPHTVVLTKNAAERIFGSSDPVGEMIKVGTDSTLYTITGVMEDVPDNSHFKFNMLGSFVTNQRANSDIWFSNSFYTYLLLEEGTSIEQLNAKIPEWLSQYIVPQMEQMLGISMEEFIQGGNSYGFYLQDLKDIHLNPDIQHGLEPSSDRRYIIIFSLVAVLILVIACINYMNLATARSAKRSREVGLRKVVGSLKGQIIWQFLFESIVVTLVSLVFAILIVELCLPYFNNLINSQLSLAYITHWYVIPGLIGLGLFISVIAGSYPAFFLASFRPVAVLSGPFKSGSGGKILRSILVIVQMTVSVIIILATMIVYKQVNYM